MERLKNLVKIFDNYQQRHPMLGFAIAVWKKYGDDEAGNQAALLTYYVFLSLLPLLLVLLSVTELLLRGNPELEAKITDAAFSYFPIIGTQLQNNLHATHKSGLGLIIGLIITFLGARGVADVMQTIFNNLWQVPRDKRPAFPKSFIRSLSIIIVGGGGLVITSVLAGYISQDHNALFKFLALLVSLALNFGVFLAVYRLSVSHHIKTEHLYVGSAVTTVMWQVLQAAGGYLVLNNLKGASALYGIFAVVLGLLFWIYLQAKVTLYAVEIDVVRTKKLWPRSLTQQPITEEDKQVIAQYAKIQKRLPHEEIGVEFNDKG